MSVSEQEDKDNDVADGAQDGISDTCHHRSPQYQGEIMRQPSISVIVPVFNTAKYLDECITSILNQTYSDFELLLVDDGSTDGSGQICDNYAIIDDRIRVFHQLNQGVSSARNTALDHAAGEYVIFLDSDDYWLINDCLETLYKTVTVKKADVVRGEYLAVDEIGAVLFDRGINQKKNQVAYKCLSSSEFLEDVIQGEFFSVLSLFKYSAIRHLRFDVQQIFLEDMDFYCRVLLQSITCVFVPVTFYAYRKYIMSSSSAMSDKKLEDSFGMCRKFSIYASEASDLQLKRYFGHRSVMMYYWTLDTVATDLYYSDRFRIMKVSGLKNIRKDTIRRMCQYSVYNKYAPFIIMPVAFSILLLRIKFRISLCIRSVIHNSKLTAIGMGGLA